MIPGYEGHFPGKKTNTVGQTFARATYQNLNAHRKLYPDGESVLKQLYNDEADETTEIISALTDHEVHAGGHPKWKDYIVPNYSGSVPLSNDCIGESFENRVRKGLKAYERKWEEQKRKERKLLVSMHPYEWKEDFMKPFFYRPEKPFKDEHQDVYFMTPGNANKFMIPGTSRVVPNWQSHFGKTFATTTKDCLNDFSIRLAELRRKRENPFRLESNESLATPRIYERGTIRDSQQDTTWNKKHEGMIPGYTGHIPANRFRFGMPFNRAAEVFRYGFVDSPIDQGIGMHKDVFEQVQIAEQSKIDEEQKLERLHRSYESY